MKIICIYVVLYISLCFEGVYSQDKSDPIFGNNTIKFQLYKKLIDNQGSMDQLIKHYIDSDSIKIDFHGIQKCFLDSTLVLLVELEQKYATIEYRDLSVLKISYTRNQLLIEDNYNRFEKILFTIQNGSINEIQVYPAQFNNRRIYLSKKSPPFYNNISKSILTEYEIKQYFNLYQLYLINFSIN